MGTFTSSLASLEAGLCQCILDGIYMRATPLSTRFLEIIPVRVLTQKAERGRSLIIPPSENSVPVENLRI